MNKEKQIEVVLIIHTQKKKFKHTQQTLVYSTVMGRTHVHCTKAKPKVPATQPILSHGIPLGQSMMR